MKLLITLLLPVMGCFAVLGICDTSKSCVCMNLELEPYYEKPQQTQKPKKRDTAECWSVRVSVADRDVVA